MILYRISKFQSFVTTEIQTQCDKALIQCNFRHIECQNY